MRWQLIEANVNLSDRGSLHVAQALGNVPFTPVRLFWVTDVPTGLVRGFHAHKNGQQVLFCLSGSIRARFDDGSSSEEIVLTPGGSGVWMKNMVWGEQTFLDPGSILLVLASNEYEETDYIRDREEFDALVQEAE